MEFPYSIVIDFPKHQLRRRIVPWIRVGIFNPKNPKNIIYALGLIDSGADITILDREIGENLGYNVEKGKKMELRGLGGGVVKGFIHKVGFLVENQDNPKDVIKYTDIATFTRNPFPETMPEQTAIYGTVGFFNKVMVTFMFPKQIIVDRLSS